MDGDFVIGVLEGTGRRRAAVALSLFRNREDEWLRVLHARLAVQSSSETRCTCVIRRRGSTLSFLRNATSFLAC